MQLKENEQKVPVPRLLKRVLLMCVVIKPRISFVTGHSFPREQLQLGVKYYILKNEY